MRYSSAKEAKLDSIKDKSIIEKLLEEFFGDSRINVNFDDLSGITFDWNTLNLSDKWRIHDCRFCMLAKKTDRGKVACARNKFLANRHAIKRKSGFVGMCYLGVTDVVEPWIYDGRVLGVFYMGSIVADEIKGIRQLEKTLRRRRYRMAGKFLEEYGDLPRFKNREFQVFRRKLKLVMDVMTHFVSESGISLERYPTQRHTLEARERVEQSLIIQRARHYIYSNYHLPLTLQSVATILNCHPHTLCRTFSKEVGVGLPEYVQRVRIEQAKKLISKKQLSIGEISFRVGFQAQSHFNRIFKACEGVTPSAWKSK